MVFASDMLKNESSMTSGGDSQSLQRIIDDLDNVISDLENFLRDKDR